MTRRVECVRCRAHRDLDLAPRCLVCGAERCTPVPPHPLDGADQAVIAAAEAIDLAILRGYDRIYWRQLTTRLREACRARALALAGRKTS